MREKQPLIILTGPTAVGKTSLSIELAKRIGGEIISADSMQVYRGMDIGSAKVTKEEVLSYTTVRSMGIHHRVCAVQIKPAIFIHIIFVCMNSNYLCKNCLLYTSGVITDSFRSVCPVFSAEKDRIESPSSVRRRDP